MSGTIELPDLNALDLNLALARHVKVEYRQDNTIDEWREGKLIGIDIGSSSRSIAAKVTDDEEMFRTALVPLGGDPPYIRFKDVTEYARNQAEKHHEERSMRNKLAECRIKGEDPPEEVKKSLGIGEFEDDDPDDTIEEERGMADTDGLIEPDTPMFVVKLESKSWVQLDACCRPTHKEPERRKSDVVPDDTSPRKIGEDIHQLLHEPSAIGLSKDAVRAQLEGD